MLLDPADTVDTDYYACQDGATFPGNHMLNLARDMNTWGLTRLVTSLGGVHVVNNIHQLPESQAYLATFFLGSNHYTRADEFFQGPSSCAYARHIVQHYAAPEDVDGGGGGQVRRLRVAEDVHSEDLGDLPLGLVVARRGLNMHAMHRLSSRVSSVSLDCAHSDVLFLEREAAVGIEMVHKIWSQI